MIKGINILFFLGIAITFVILISVWTISYWKRKNHTKGKIPFILFIVFIALIILSYFTKLYTKPIVLTNDDIYGTYTIDRTKFPGKQAEWKYQNFKLKIKPEHLILKYRINDDEWKSEKVDISFTTGYFDLNKKEYCNRRTGVHSDLTNRHIIRDNPTL